MLNLKKIAYFTILVIACIYIAFPLKIDQWESYMFASGVEGLYQVKDIYSMFGVQLHDDIQLDRYHPNHPLLHFLVYCLYHLFIFLNISVRAISIFKALNTLFGILAIIWIFKITYYYTKDYAFSTLLTLFFAFTNVVWYYILSGEVYSAPFSFLLLCFWLLLKINEDIKKDQNILNLLVWMTIAYCLAVTFHLLASPFAIVIFCFFVGLKRQYPNLTFFKYFTISFLISFFWAILFYGFIYVYLVKAYTVESYLQSMFHLSGMNLIYDQITMSLNTTNYFHTLSNLIGMKTNSFFNSLIRTNLSGVIIYKFLLLFFILAGSYRALKREENPFLYKILYLWILIYLTLMVFVITEPVDDYWIFVIFPLFFTISLLLKDSSSPVATKIILTLSIIINFYINFYYDIYPKNQAKETDYCVLAEYKEDVDKCQNFVFIYNYEHENYFDEVWYVNYWKKKKNIVFVNDYELNLLIEKQENLLLFLEGAFPSKSNGVDQVMFIASYGNPLLHNLSLSFEKVGYEMHEINIVKKENTVFEKLAQYPAWYTPSPFFLSKFTIQIYKNR